MAKRMVFIAAVITVSFVIAIFAGSEKNAGVDVQNPKLEMSPAAVPEMITYQGVLTDGGGNPLDTTVSMTFTIYDASSGGTALWTETHGSVTVVGGLFTVLLGSFTPISSTVFDQPDRWLGLAVGGDPEMPRERIASVPYAYRAAYADNVGGDGDHSHHSLDAADGSPTEAVYVDNDGNVGIGTTSPSERLDVAGQIHASGTITSGSSIAIDGINDRITATSGTIDFDNENLVTTGEVGIGVASPSTPLHVAQPNSGANQVLGFFSNPSDVADSRASIDIGVGTALPTGWRLEGSSNNIELHNAVVAAPGLVLTGGHAVGVGTASPTAKLDVVTEGGLALSANSNTGYALEATTNEGIIAATAFNNSTGGLVGSSIGLWANSGVSLIDLVGYGRIGVMATGEDYGLWALSGENGTGVYGAAPGTYDIGVHGYAGGASGDGVVGECPGTYGIGVRGYTSGTYGFGVYGYAPGANAYAGYFNGRVNVTGTLTKGAGAFKIDHPLDPANKFLYHSFVESPDMKNIYDGVVVLDNNGEGWVELPEWFEALNRDFRYQLTCIGGFAHVYIEEEIAYNQFKIAGGESGMKVSWQVTGIRKDAFANAHRIQVEEEKSDIERGKFAHPKEHGMPETDGIDYVRFHDERE